LVSVPLRGKGRKLRALDILDRIGLRVSVPLRGKGRKLQEEILRLGYGDPELEFPSPCGEKVENYKGNTVGAVGHVVVSVPLRGKGRKLQIQ
jgi:hypothetical protein